MAEDKHIHKKTQRKLVRAVKQTKKVRSAMTTNRTGDDVPMDRRCPRCERPFETLAVEFLGGRYICSDCKYELEQSVQAGKMTTNRTLGPWKCSQEGHISQIFTIRGENEYPICDTKDIVSTEEFHKTDTETNKANAEFIVRACNSHDALVGALKDIQQIDIPSILEDLCYQGPDAPKKWKTDRENFIAGFKDCFKKVNKIAQSALRLAGEEG